MLSPNFLYSGSFPITFNWRFHKAHPTTATHHCTRFGLQMSITFMQVLWNSRLAHSNWMLLLLSDCVPALCSVRLCETLGWQGAAQVLDWSRLSCQSSQRPAAERSPRNRLHWVHGPWHLAPRSLQRWTQPGTSVAPQHSHRWGELLQLHWTDFEDIKMLSWIFIKLWVHSTVCIAEFFALLSFLPFHLLICKTIRTWPRVVWNSVTFERNFSCYKSEHSKRQPLERGGQLL